MGEGAVLVQVAPAAEAGREIGWDGPNIAERLDRRVDDIRRAVVSAAMAIAQSLPGMPEATDWLLEELSASFGITLTAEAGALVTKASAGATFEVTVTFKREGRRHAGHGSDPG
jgi:hypothetical protein